MPMPGPMTPRAARPAPMYSMLIRFLLLPGRSPGFIGTVVVGRVGASSVGGLQLVPFGVDAYRSPSSATWPSSWSWLSMARTMNMRVRTLKMRAWIEVQHELQAVAARPG